MYAGVPGAAIRSSYSVILDFKMQPSQFPTEMDKITFLIALLTGRALAWATTTCQHKLNSYSLLQSFLAVFRDTFDHSSKEERSSSLLRIRQGSRSEANYASGFRTQAAASGWNDVALQAAFL